MSKNQTARNAELIKSSPNFGQSIESKVLPFYLDIKSPLGEKEKLVLQALEIDAARISVQALTSLAKINELDHLGGGMDLIPALQLTLSLVDYEKVEFTIEHAHTSIGYYSSLASRGFLGRQHVIDQFRRSLDIAGHVSWVPGGTQLNGGRLGVMVPVAVGQALGKKAKYGKDAWVICHTGDAGWISGQALNGFNIASLHNAPITFVMHRNGIQLSGANKDIMDKDPRPMIAAMGIKIIETPSLYDQSSLYQAYQEAKKLCEAGIPNMIYPTGGEETLNSFAKKFNIEEATSKYAEKNKLDLNAKVWVPGSIMSYRDVECMLDSVALVNKLPGGKCHHDGHMKGRDEAAVLSNPLLTFSDAQVKALEEIKAKAPKVVVTKARPAFGTKNLTISDEVAAAVKLPQVGETVSPRAGSQAAYAAVAKAHPKHVFIVSCDLDPSTKLDAAKKEVPAENKFEVSIEEQAATLLADGLAMSGNEPQLNVVSTFAAFFEGIAREGLELWRYQRNLTGVNEGLNVVMHLSHVGAFTGRDHFSGWSLDWINMSLPYIPYIRKFYAPADARAAFSAVRDMAAHYGGHILSIPRDNLPILTKQNSQEALYNPNEVMPALTEFRKNGAKKAIVALGHTAYLAEKAAASLGNSVDVLIVNSLPLADNAISDLIAKYPQGIVTAEDGIIGTSQSGLLGFAGLTASLIKGAVPMKHIGIEDPRIAPSSGYEEVWEHFGITAEKIAEAVKAL